MTTKQQSIIILLVKNIGLLAQYKRERYEDSDYPTEIRASFLDMEIVDLQDSIKWWTNRLVRSVNCNECDREVK